MPVADATVRYFLLARDGTIGSDPSIVPVARYNAGAIAWHRWEQPAVAVCGIVRVAAVVPIFPAGTYRHYVAHTDAIQGPLPRCVPQYVLVCFFVPDENFVSLVAFLSWDLLSVLMRPLLLLFLQRQCCRVYFFFA